MPNVVMNEGKLSVLAGATGGINLLTDTIKAILLVEFTPDPDTHQFLSDISANKVTGTTDQTLAGKVLGKDMTSDFAYFDANDLTFAAVPAGAAAARLGIYKDTGTPSTSKVIEVLDIPDVTPNGGDIGITFAAPTSGGVLKLA